MTIKALLKVDGLDTRREVLILLQRLSVADRLSWLEWCCANAKTEGHERSPAVVRGLHSGRSMECFLDFWSLVGQHGLDADHALAALERLAGKRGVAYSGRKHGDRTHVAGVTADMKMALLPHAFLTRRRGRYNRAR